MAASPLALGAWASLASVGAGDVCGAGFARRTMARHAAADVAATAVTSRAADGGRERRVSPSTE